MTPKQELIKIMKQVDRDALNLKPNPFHLKETPLEQEGESLWNSGRCATLKAMQPIHG